MSPERTSLREVAESTVAVQTARAEPIQQEPTPRQSMDFIRSLVLDIPIQTTRETPVSENMNIERMLETQLENEAKKLKKKNDLKDVVTVDIPLLIRLLEYAKEDAKTDMDLHSATERIISLSKEYDVLTMDNYEAIVSDTLGGNTDYPNPAFAGEPQSESIDFLKKLAGIK